MSAGSTPREPLWTAAAAAAATAGRTTGDWTAGGVSIDSRTLVPGDLFVALQGPNFDGHRFAAQALAAGAAAACVARIPDDVAPGAPLLVVDDTFSALERLGQGRRRESQARMIGVTGSVGKTGTKEALIACLGEQAPTHGTLGSLNNHWGVPLTLARLPQAARYGVFELGMNHPGEIGPLSRQVRPHVALITTIAPAHLGHFPTVEAIADAKAEIFEGMVAGSTAVLNLDNPYFDRLAAAARERNLRVLGFGAGEGADARLLSSTLEEGRSLVSALVLGRPIAYEVGLAGRHWVHNSLAILLAVTAIGANLPEAARFLARLSAVKGRGNRVRIALAEGAITVVDESYNASPVAMEAAFQVLGRMQPHGAGRRIAVLGEMLELGEQSAALHAGLADGLCRAGVDLVFCCGPNMAHLIDCLPASVRGGHTAESRTLARLVADQARAGDVILIKGSAGSKMRCVLDQLQCLEPGKQAMAVSGHP